MTVPSVALVSRRPSLGVTPYVGRAGPGLRGTGAQCPAAAR
jgi:hypothetical protein